MFNIGLIARLDMEISKADLAPAFWPHGFHGGVKSEQRQREVAGIGRDASLACAEHRVGAVDALKCRAARSRIALVARPGYFAEIFAARSLKHVAAEACHVADLPGGGELQRVVN